MKKSKEVFQNRGNGKGAPNGTPEISKSGPREEKKIVDALKLLRQGLDALEKHEYQWKEGLKAFIESVVDRAARANHAREAVLWHDVTGKGHDKTEDRSKLTPLLNEVMPHIDFYSMDGVASVVGGWLGEDYRVWFRPGTDGKDELVVEPIEA